ncbi:MAG: hypothetical protein EAZ53_03655 [Bacteroidetes bacterium]|nr:MAG: hypothetical protein EAZ53_03655 [Bacteroidota bacterium]
MFVFTESNNTESVEKFVRFLEQNIFVFLILLLDFTFSVKIIQPKFLVQSQSQPQELIKIFMVKNRMFNFKYLINNFGSK